MSRDKAWSLWQWDDHNKVCEIEIIEIRYCMLEYKCLGRYLRVLGADCCFFGLRFFILDFDVQIVCYTYFFWWVQAFFRNQIHRQVSLIVGLWIRKIWIYTKFFKISISSFCLCVWNSVYIHLCICACAYVHTYICIYIHTRM